MQLRSSLCREEAVPRHLAQALVVFVIGFAAAARAEGPPAQGHDIVFVADGAGNYQVASKMLRSTVVETGLPLTVETFVWSHGYKMVLIDQIDLSHARLQGERLAEVVLAYRHEHPQAHIHLVGHSAGSMVVLSAAEHLPPGTLEHIVLLSPSVSSDYDIRPALRCVRGSVEVHYSGHDWLYLGLCTKLVGCADRLYCGASGRRGFNVRIDSPEDAALLPRLQQHPWQTADRVLGHNGGHYGAYQPEYLKERVLPVLLGSPPAEGFVAADR
jgi:pimeloyl-ACP methyl ester carboxylesterase